MAGGGSVGSIYAEATLDVSAFVAAAGSLDAAAAQVAAALGQASLGALAAQSAVDGLASGIASGGGAAVSAAAGISRSVAQALGSAAASAPSLGGRFSAGLASGIASGRSAVIAAAASVARAAISAAQSALQIHSPSRVTADFGEAFDRGFVKGMLTRSPEVVRAVERVVTVTPSATAEAVAARAVSPVPPRERVDYDRLAAAAASRPTVLMLDGRTLAEASAAQTARAQNARTRRIAVRYGAR